MHKFQKIRDLQKEGKSFSEMAREARCDRKTARKYAQNNTPPKYKPRDKPTREDPLEPYYDQIQGLIEKAPNITGSEIYEWLVEQGYKGSERTVQRKLKTRRDQKPKERDFEQRYEPGEQAQFDFKESLEVPFITGLEKVHLHVSTLPFSDICVAKAYPFKNYECFMDGVHSFFETIGGMTRNIRFDNLSPVVSKILDNGGRIYTKKFSEAHKHYGFGLLPCSPGRGNEKGDVERDIQTWTRRFLNHIKIQNLVFKDFADLNHHLSGFLLKRRAPEKSERFIEEQRHLSPLPFRDEDVLCRSEEVRASDFGTVTIMKSVYSVPDEVIGVKCWVVPGPYEVKIYRRDTRTLVATHRRRNEQEHSLLLEHCLRGLLRKPRAMIRWAHREILFPEVELRAFYQRLKSQDSTSAEREFLRTINLVQQVPLAEIITAVSLILESGRVSFEEVKELLLIARRPENLININERIKQEPIKPNLEAYNQLIPRVGGG